MRMKKKAANIDRPGPPHAEHCVDGSALPFDQPVAHGARARAMLRCWRWAEEHEDGALPIYLAVVEKGKLPMRLPPEV